MFYYVVERHCEGVCIFCKVHHMDMACTKHCKQYCPYLSPRPRSATGKLQCASVPFVVQLLERGFQCDNGSTLALIVVRTYCVYTSRTRWRSHVVNVALKLRIVFSSFEFCNNCCARKFSLALRVLFRVRPMKAFFSTMQHWTILVCVKFTRIILKKLRLCVIM